MQGGAEKRNHPGQEQRGVGKTDVRYAALGRVQWINLGFNYVKLSGFSMVYLPKPDAERDSRTASPVS